MKVSGRIASLLCATICVFASPLAAQEVEFKGVATGCFFTTGPCDPASSASWFGLTFNSGAFDGVTTDGKLDVSGAAGNLGTFSLNTQPAGYDVGFILNVFFSLPTLANPNTVYQAAIKGRVSDDPWGGVHIFYEDSPQIFNFDGPTAMGYFSLGINRTDVYQDGGPTPVTGTIKATVTPEPATLTLLATGLAGLIPVARRRYRKGTTRS